MRELGLYAVDPDTEQEILFAYINYGEEAEYINNSISEKKEHYYNMIITVDNANNVAITVDPNTVYVNEKELNEKLEKLKQQIYPVGSIYMSVNKVNPSALFGGTWAPWGAGKVPVCVDENDTDFNEVEKTRRRKNTYINN